MEMLLSNQAEIVIGYSEKSYPRKREVTYPGTKFVNLDKVKLEEIIPNSGSTSDRLVVIYDGIHMEEKYSKTCYLRKPDAVQVLNLFSLQSISLARSLTWSKLSKQTVSEHKADAKYSKLNQEVLKLIEKSWIADQLEGHDLASYLEVRESEIDSISRSDMVLLNSDLDKLSLVRSLGDQLPQTLLVPVVFDGSTSQSMQSQLASIFSGSSPQLRRGSLQLCSSFSETSDLANLSIFLETVWPKVVSHDDRIRLDVMHLGSATGGGVGRGSQVDPKEMSKQVFDLCHGVQGVRVVDVRFSSLRVESEFKVDWKV